MENNMEVSLKIIKIELPYNRAIPLQGLYLKEAKTLCYKEMSANPAPPHILEFCSKFYSMQ